jgi:hypothetical protein
MNKEFIKYEQALALKELGFDESCLGFYEFGSMDKEWHLRTKHISKNEYDDDVIYVLKAPTFSQAFRWFREEHRLSSWICNSDTNKYFYTILQNGRIVKATELSITYEEAQLACLIKLIEIVKKMTHKEKDMAKEAAAFIFPMFPTLIKELKDTDRLVDASLNIGLAIIKYSILPNITDYEKKNYWEEMVKELELIQNKRK